MKRTTINDVAKLANVSKTTVSHYLNNRFNYMGKNTKLRIAEAIEELSYNPSFIAKSMTSKRTMTVGIIVANILHNFSTQIIRSVEDYAHSKGYQVIVCNADDQPQKERDYVNMLLAKQIDGIIVIPTVENNKLFNKLYEEDFPIIFVDRYIENLNISSYLLDNKQSIQIAFDYFLSRGFESIGFISQELINITPRNERQTAYLNICDVNRVIPFTISAPLNEIRNNISNAIKNNNLPKAIIVANDLALLEVLREIKKHNIKIPEEISIISIDNIEFTEFFNPSLTVIAQPTFEIGKAAAVELFNRINKQPITNKINRFSPQLIERSSVKNGERE